MAGGGFQPGLRRSPHGLNFDEPAFLASEHYHVKRGGVTLDSSQVDADENGDKIIPAGTFITPGTADPDKYVPYDGLTDERQTVTVTGSPTGGTFTLTFDGETTDPIAFDADAQEVEFRLESLGTVGADNVEVSGNAGGPYVVEFRGDLADTDVAEITASGAGLTGGTTPSVTVATGTAGGASTSATADPDVSGYTLEAHNLRDGDVIAGIILHGSVLEARVHPAPDATIRAACKGRITFQ